MMIAVVYNIANGVGISQGQEVISQVAALVSHRKKVEGPNGSNGTSFWLLQFGREAP